jgi:hypothetical protein
LTLGSSIDKCPIVSYKIYEDENFITEWSNLDILELFNPDDPDAAYLRVALYEEDREDWKYKVYL